MKQILVIIIMLFSTPAWAEYEQPIFNPLKVLFFAFRRVTELERVTF